MEYVLVVYRSRNVSVRAYNYLVKNGQICALVSTPRQTGVGCGLSVKTNMAAVRTFYSELSSAETFVGFFVAKITARGQTITRI